MWKTLGLYARKTLEYYMKSIMESSMYAHKNIASKT